MTGLVFIRQIEISSHFRLDLHVVFLFMRIGVIFQALITNFFYFPSFAKHLIEDTIRRNASPVRETAGVVGAGSCSSLTSSNSDETHGRAANRNTAMANQQLPFGSTVIGNHQKVGRHQTAGTLLHSLSTNDASVGEYKFTVNVGQHNIKITGDSLELVRVSVIWS